MILVVKLIALVVYVKMVVTVVVIVQKQKIARNGEIVVAMTEDNEVTLKTFYKEDGYFRLQPENSTMDPIILDKVYIVVCNNNMDYDCFEEWNDKVFSSENKAIQYVRERFCIPNRITFSRPTYLDGVIGDIYLDGNPSDWLEPNSETYDRVAFSRIEIKEVNLEN
jgi:hypothetical protein